MKLYSTKEAARVAKVSGVTLRRWLSLGKFRPSIKTAAEWLFTPGDIKRLLAYRAKNYWHGQGRPKKRANQ